MAQCRTHCRSEPRTAVALARPRMVAQRHRAQMRRRQPTVVSSGLSALVCPRGCALLLAVDAVGTDDLLLLHRLIINTAVQQLATQYNILATQHDSLPHAATARRHCAHGVLVRGLRSVLGSTLRVPCRTAAVCGAALVAVERRQRATLRSGGARGGAVPIACLGKLGDDPPLLVRLARELCHQHVLATPLLHLQLTTYTSTAADAAGSESPVAALSAVLLCSRGYCCCAVLPPGDEHSRVLTSAPRTTSAAQCRRCAAALNNTRANSAATRCS